MIAEKNQLRRLSREELENIVMLGGIYDGLRDMTSMQIQNYLDSNLEDANFLGNQIRKVTESERIRVGHSRYILGFLKDIKELYFDDKK